MTSRRNPSFHIAWTTITYRSVALALLTVVAIIGAGTYLLFPNSAPVVATMDLASRLADSAGIGKIGKRAGAVGPQQAHFTALDGTVRVKKANSNTWVIADFNLPLDKGDVVQTSSEGIAKVFFPADGTNYTVKPDSLIVVEENSSNSQQQTQVAVQVTTGTVDLNTGTYSQGSSSQVIVAGATASLAPESSAMVHNDPRSDEHDFLLKRGSAKVTRNTESMLLAEYEKVSFKATAPSMSKTKEVGPPTLIAPPHMMPVYVASSGKSIDFSWTPATNSHGFRVRISRNPYFSSTVFDHVVQNTELKVSGLKEGTYYWVVTSQDANGHESVESERNQFSIVLRTGDAVAVALDLEPFVQHGHVIYIKGKTDAGARVMVNGQEVPVLRGDGSFDFFTAPLPVGENLITVTAQNAKGGVNTKQKKVVIE